jgi:hypothetical protein
MILSRWCVLVVVAFLLSCVCMPTAQISTEGVNNSNPTSSPKKSEVVQPTPTLAEADEVQLPKPGKMQPTENENSPGTLPTEMGITEPEKPSLKLDNTYKDVGNLFRVNYPAGWVLSRVGDWHDICIDQEKSACFHAQTQDLEGRSLIVYMDDTYESFKRTVGDYSMFKREEIRLVGYPAVMFEQSYNWKDQYNQGFAAYLINSDKNTGYSVLAEIINQMEDYDLIYETLRKMVYSFSVGELKDFP